jgi:ribokinase
MSDGPTLVFGPAYLDQVIRIGEPIADHPVDLGCDGFLEPGTAGRLEIVCPNGSSIVLTRLNGGGVPAGRLITAVDVLPVGSNREIAAVETLQDLGGMGAGYAAALGGRLISALAGSSDPITQFVRKELSRHGIDHIPVVFDTMSNADTTIIVTSGKYGDKLPVGLRGCHSAITSETLLYPERARQVVVASLSNALMHVVLMKYPSAIRVLAPSARNCRDRMYPLGNLAESTDVLALNRAEWGNLSEHDRQAFEKSDAVISITQGPEGAEISWRGLGGARNRHFEPAFPRQRPPVDTNRAGEAFAANLLIALSESDRFLERKSMTDESVGAAARRAAAAAGLVIDLPFFGFPKIDEVLATLRNGVIP